MVASKKKISSLSSGLDLVFRSKNRQVMLSQIHKDRDFEVFTRGREQVQVITSEKEMFSATMVQAGESLDEFLLTPVLERSPVRVGETLLLLFQSQRQTALAQASVKAVIGRKLRVISVDPRSTIRYKTRMRVMWDLLGDSAYASLGRKALTLVREENEITKGVISSSSFALVRDFVRDIEGNETPRAELLMNSVMEPALMTDLSVGGFCMLTKDSPRIKKLRDNVLLLMECSIPHIDRDYHVELVAAARHIRTLGSASVVHCMFVEPLRIDQIFV
jgi:hypothetical protein